MSSYLQQLVCFVGQNNVYQEASAMLLKVGNITVEAKQIERVCHHYGEVLEQKTKADTIDTSPVFEETHYAMMDGTMLLTKTDGWKELKLGRIFNAQDILHLSEKRSEIRASTYVAHLGKCEDFLEKFEKELCLYKKVVFINDGARWIWDWIETHYPSALQILDFYHAMEHLHDFANTYYKDESEKKNWIKINKKLLLADGVVDVIKAIGELKTESLSIIAEKKQGIINYYSKNIKRMQYQTFLSEDLLIGSGAIEAAHRNVIQKRCKLSGQRWTPKGVQQIINIRVIHKNDRWEEIIDLTNKIAA